MSRLRVACALFMALLLPALSMSSSLHARADHIVSKQELRSAVQSAAQQRQANIEKINALFRSSEVASTLKKTGIQLEQVTEAVPLLSNEELALLSARAEQIESDIAAGALNNQQITYIIIALATAVIVLILVD